MPVFSRAWTAQLRSMSFTVAPPNTSSSGSPAGGGACENSFCAASFSCSPLRFCQPCCAPVPQPPGGSASGLGPPSPGYGSLARFLAGKQPGRSHARRDCSSSSVYAPSPPWLFVYWLTSSISLACMSHWAVGTATWLRIRPSCTSHTAAHWVTRQPVAIGSAARDCSCDSIFCCFSECRRASDAADVSSSKPAALAMASFCNDKACASSSGVRWMTPCCSMGVRACRKSRAPSFAPESPVPSRDVIEAPAAMSAIPKMSARPVPSKALLLLLVPRDGPV